jgi:hypothetical protein
LAIVLSVPSLLYRFCALIYKRYIRIWIFRFLSFILGSDFKEL